MPRSLGLVHIHRRSLLAAVAAVALMASGCGGTPTSSPSANGKTKITVGVIPIVDVAPIYLGVKQGFFDDEGLEVTLETAQGGAAIVPAVVSGQYQFGFSNTTSLLLANSQGLPLKVVAAGVSSTGEDGKDFGGVIVKPDSTIKTAKDLAGKRIAVNTLKNINTTTINKVVREAGGDPSTISYVELPFPDIAAAVAKGDVDAGQVVEPFLTIATGQGDRQVVSNYAGTDPDLTVGMYFTSQQYAGQNAKVVDGFTAAMKKSMDYAAAHPDDVRAILSTYTKIDPEVQKNLVLPKWPSAVDRDSVKLLGDLAKKDGLITKSVDLDALLP
jgi:NitT/TauT family transport system substrate-binding protein